MAITTLGDNFRVIIEGGSGARFAGIAEGFANDAEAYSADAAGYSASAAGYSASAAGYSADAEAYAAGAAMSAGFAIPASPLTLTRELREDGDSLTAGISGDKVSDRIDAKTTGTITNAGVGGDTSTTITARISALSAGYRAGVWSFVDIGTNDIGTVGGAKTVIDNVATVRGLYPANNLVLWGSPLPRNWGTSDGAYYAPWTYQTNNGRAHNMRQTLAETHRDRYWDAYTTLMRSGGSSAGDLTDISNYQVPRSLRVNADATIDNLHPRGTGNDIVAAHKVAMLTAFEGGAPYVFPEQVIYTRGAASVAALARTAAFGTVGVLGSWTSMSVDNADMAELFEVKSDGALWLKSGATLDATIYTVPVKAWSPRGVCRSNVKLYIGADSAVAPLGVALAGTHGVVADTGLTNGNKFTLALRFRRSGTTLQYLTGGPSSNFSAYITASDAGDPNKLNVVMKNTSGVTCLSVKMTGTITAATGWVTLAVSVDLSGAGALQAYAAGESYGSDASVAGAPTFVTGTAIKLQDTMQIGADGTGAANIWQGDIAMLWLTDDAVDLSVSGNRRALFNIDGTLVARSTMNSVGGKAPKLLIGGNAADWARGFNHASDLDATLVTNRAWFPA